MAEDLIAELEKSPTPSKETRKAYGTRCNIKIIYIYMQSEG